MFGIAHHLCNAICLNFGRTYNINYILHMKTGMSWHCLYIMLCLAKCCGAILQAIIDGSYIQVTTSNMFDFKYCNLCQIMWKVLFSVMWCWNTKYNYDNLQIMLLSAEAQNRNEFNILSTECAWRQN